MRVEWVRRKFSSESGEELAGAIHLMFALACQSQQNFREGLQIVAVVGGHLHLLHAPHAVAVYTTEPEEGALERRHATDDVVAGAEGHVGILRIRVNRQKGVRF